MSYFSTVRLRDMRKTIEVKKVLDYVNKQLSRTDEYCDDKFKAGMCTMIERMLYDTNQYNGYTPLNDVNVGGVGYYNRFYHMKS
jgi:hypothetical protein